MQLSLYFLLALLAEASAAKDVPTFQINLDLKPRKRWQHVAEFYRPWYRDNFKKLDLHLEVNPWKAEEVDEMTENVTEEIKEEVQGIVEALNHSHATLHSFMRQQMLYELGLTEGFDCSGIVATKGDGSIIHGRNLDLGEKFKWGDDITFYAEYMRSGKLVAKSINFFGGVGVHTGIHLGSDGRHWTFEQNTRLELNENFGHDVSGSKWVHNTLVAKRNGGKMFALEGRRLLLEKETFTDALDAFSTTTWMTPQYFILASSEKYHGAVLTVGRAQPEAKKSFYDIMALSAAGGKWFLVQTNDDHFGLKLDSRRDAAIDGMKKQKKEHHDVADSDVMTVLRTPPVCNGATLFSWVVTPSTDAEKLQRGACLKED